MAYNGDIADISKQIQNQMAVSKMTTYSLAEAFYVN